MAKSGDPNIRSHSNTTHKHVFGTALTATVCAEPARIGTIEIDEYGVARVCSRPGVWRRIKYVAIRDETSY